MKIKSNYFDIKLLKNLYKKNTNITNFLKNKLGIDYNTPEIIEIAYELQAGSYIEAVERNLKESKSYASELSLILKKHINSENTLLDVGTGEMTTISLVLSMLDDKPKVTFALDLSWSRIYRGMSFAEKYLGDYILQLKPFVADIFEIPFADKSIDFTTSSHALEPNGASLKELLHELFRVTKKQLILFEPYYEKNSPKGKKRMDSLGYIKDLEKTAKDLGGKVVDIIKINNISNNLNPTYCFVIEPSNSTNVKKPTKYSVPGTNLILKRKKTYYCSIESGVSFPIIENIPILKSNSKILTTTLDK